MCKLGTYKKQKQLDITLVLMILCESNENFIVIRCLVPHKVDLHKLKSIS